MNSVEMSVMFLHHLFLTCAVLGLVDPQLQLKALDIPLMQIIILLFCCVELPELPLFERLFYNANRKRYFPEIQFLEMPELFKTGCVCVLGCCLDGVFQPKQ